MFRRSCLLAMALLSFALFGFANNAEATVLDKLQMEHNLFRDAYNEWVQNENPQDRELGEDLFIVFAKGQTLMESIEMEFEQLHFLIFSCRDLNGVQKLSNAYKQLGFMIGHLAGDSASTEMKEHFNNIARIIKQLSRRFQQFQQ